MLTAVLLSSLLLASCVSAVGQQAVGSDGEIADGGVVRIGTTSDLIPTGYLSGRPQHTRLVYDTLTEYNPDSLEPQPLLADSWNISDDGLSVTLGLRDNVKFHDGRPFTSKDVEFSLRTYADPTNSGQLARTAGRIAQYDTSDPHQIVLHLSEPTNNIFDLFENVPILDEKTFDEFESGTKYNGTGPFRFEHWTPGKSVVYEANPDYWDGEPAVDGVEINVVADEKTMFTQLRSGQLDLISGTARDSEALEDSPAFDVIDLEGVSSITYLGTNVTSPGLDDPRVRKALSLTVDRNRILEDVYQGRGRNSQLPWPNYSPAFDEAANDQPRDVEQAKELIEQATSDNGPLPVFSLNYTAGALDDLTTAQIVKDNLAEIGVAVDLVPVENTVMLSKLINGEFEDLWIYNHTFSQYDPSTLVSAAFPFNSAKNSSRFIDEDYSDAVNRSWNTPDPEGLDALVAYSDLNEQILGHNFLIELSLPDTELITASNLRGVRWNKRGIYNLADAYFVG